MTGAGVDLRNSEAAPKPTLMFYNFQTRLLTPVLQLEDPAPTAPNLALRAMGGHCGLPSGEPGIVPLRWRRTSSKRHTLPRRECRSRDSNSRRVAKYLSRNGSRVRIPQSLVDRCREQASA
jgi:hypothetical protein